MQMSFCRFRLLHLWTLVIVLFCAQPALAARLLQVYIEQDGNVVAHTYYDDGGRADAATVWRYLQEPPMMVDDDATRVDADANDPLEALLEGDLELRIQHVDRVIAQARLSTLMLRRVDEQTQAWFLPATEVERTADVAGLGDPTVPAGRAKVLVGLLVIVALATLILVGVVVAVVFFVSRPGPKAQNEA